uniref:Uncharacterized protein n=1 Tax=Cacopsylla melanoneura TaxID=428564 RepID=A0A8D9B4Z2_9HEMI
MSLLLDPFQFEIFIIYMYVHFRITTLQVSIQILNPLHPHVFHYKIVYMKSSKWSNSKCFVLLTTNSMLISRQHEYHQHHAWRYAVTHTTHLSQIIQHVLNCIFSSVRLETPI